MHRTLLAITILCAASIAHAQTVALNLSSVTDNGSSTSFNNHMNFGGNETNLATGEVEHYSPNNVSTAGGVITLTANASNLTSGAITSGTESSGMPTPGGFSITNGDLEITAQISADGPGDWAALWLEPADPASLPPGTDCEMDILESPFNTPSKYQATSHISGTQGPEIVVPVGNLAAANTYGINISPTQVQFKLNGAVVGTAPNSPACANVPMMLLANVALGGPWPSSYSNGQPIASGQMVISQISYTGNQASGGLIGAAAPIPMATAAVVSAAPATANPSAAATVAPTSAAGGDPGPDGGAVTDCQGNAWMVTAPSSPGHGGHVMEGTSYIPGGGGTAAIDVVGCQVYGKDDGFGPVNPGGWFLLSGGGQYWTPSPSPPGESGAAQPQLAAAPVPKATAAIVPAAPAKSSCPGTAAGVGGFHVAGGQIIGPDGKPWVARGINVYSDSAGASNPAAITATFPGLNFVRYIVRSLNDPSTYDAFVNAMTGRIVEFENHPDGGGDQDAGPPQGIAAESSWYASMANHFKSNPYVWFGTFNEPMPTSNLSAWQQSTYNAIRGTGSNAMLMVEVAGSRPSNLQQGLDPGVYASMTNIIWDVHVYPYQNDYSTDETSIANNINGMIAAAQKITSADGIVPVIIGESGPSTTGEGLDPNGYETVQGLITIAASGTMGGLAPFTYYPGFDSPNDLTNSSGNVTVPYGQYAQIFINMNVVPQSACQQNADAQQAIASATASLQAPQ